MLRACVRARARLGRRLAPVGAVKTPAGRGRMLAARSAGELRAKGWLVDQVERVGSWTGNKDLFGCWDLLCVAPAPGPRVVFVQVTTQGGASGRRRKIKASGCYEALDSVVGVVMLLHIWRKVGTRWTLTVEKL